MRFLSIDPSMSNTALVWGYIKENKLELIDYSIVHTEKSSNKKLPVMVDRLERIRLIFSKVDEVLSSWQPDICFGELPSGSQSSAASIGIGISLSALAKLTNLTTVTPTDVKKIIGKGVISKDQIMDYCADKYIDFNFEKKKDGSLVKARMEHVCDAIVIAEAAVKKGFTVPTKKVKSNGREYEVVPIHKIIEANKEISSIYSPCKFGCKNAAY